MAGKDKTPGRFNNSAFQTIFALERYLCLRQKLKKQMSGQFRLISVINLAYMFAKYPILFSFLFYSVLLYGQGQKQKPDLIGARVSYGLQFPALDLAQRFGSNFAAGVGFDWQSGRKNWIIGLESQFHFGESVKEDPLQGLRTAEGNIVGNDRELADIQLRRRGIYVGALAGKWLPFGKNAQSGLRVTFGAGLLQHKIRIQKDVFRAVPQVSEEYAKGYDRLSNGLALHQFIGYQYMSKDRRMNINVGFEFFQAFTQGRRSFQYDLRRPDDQPRLDGLIGARATWILPFFLDKADQILY